MSAHPQVVSSIIQQRYIFFTSAVPLQTRGHCAMASWDDDKATSVESG